MAFNPRKLLPIPGEKTQCADSCFGNGNKLCNDICKNSCGDCENLPPPPPVHLISDPRNHLVRTSMYLMICLISSALLCAILLTIVRVYYYKRNNRRRREAMFLNTHQDFLDENRGPEIDNPFWHINFVGLPESVIESITMVRYEKCIGLVEGTDCSVCLSEFEEGESLRLLPKCSHAFHVPCIDTWLRSHKTCPMCRAPIVNDVNAVNVARVGISLPEVSGTGSREEEWVLENHESRVDDDDDVGNDGNRDGDSTTLSIQGGNAAGSSSRSRSCDADFRVSSDLAGDRQVVVSEEDMQPIRRSVSLDSPSAMMIYNAVSGLRQGEHLGNLESNLEKVKSTKLKVVSKQDGGSSSKSGMTKSCSVGSSLSKGHIAVKRSVSSGGKFLFFRDSRSQDMNLPM